MGASRAHRAPIRKRICDDHRRHGPQARQAHRATDLLANRDILGPPEDRRHGRIVPRNPVGRLTMPNGISITCRIIDVSQSGAGIATRERPPIGTLVTLGKAAWCAISKMASRSSSPAWRTAISSKRTLPATKFARRLFRPALRRPCDAHRRYSRKIPRKKKIRSNFIQIPFQLFTDV